MTQLGQNGGPIGENKTVKKVSCLFADHDLLQSYRKGYFRRSIFMQIFFEIPHANQGGALLRSTSITPPRSLSKLLSGSL